MVPTYPKSWFYSHPGEVLVLAIANDGVQSHDAGDGDQESHSEHEHDQELLAFVQVHLPQLEDWQSEDKEVKDDVDDRSA